MVTGQMIPGGEAETRNVSCFGGGWGGVGWGVWGSVCVLEGEASSPAGGRAVCKSPPPLQGMCVIVAGGAQHTEGQRNQAVWREQNNG